MPVDCGNFNAGDGQSKEKTIPCNRTPGEDRKLARNGGGQATRTHVKFVACFDYGISLVGLFSWGLSLGREGSRTKPGTLSPSLSLSCSDSFSEKSSRESTPFSKIFQKFND